MIRNVWKKAREMFRKKNGQFGEFGIHPLADRSNVVPTNCPSCSGMIVLIEDEGIYRCAGLQNEKEIQAYHPFPNLLLPSVTHVDPCDWFGTVEDFGRGWE